MADDLISIQKLLEQYRADKTKVSLSELIESYLYLKKLEEQKRENGAFCRRPA